MADRTVVYRLRADIGGFKAQMAQAGASVQAAAGTMTSASKEGARFRQGLTTVGDTAGKVGLVAAAGLGVIAVATANFDKAMSGVAATGSEATAAMDDLRAAAIKAGADTAFSASEAAAGMEALLKAGVSVQDVLGGGLDGALSLAAAGELEVADAAEIAATALVQFKLAGEDVPHVADLLAAGAGKAQGDVSDLGQALAQSGLVASQMGLSIEETTGTLSAFASAGLLGSDAGTSFKSALLRLANPTKESSQLMSELGINAYDATGAFVGVAEVAEQLKVAFEGKTQAERDSALATIFGSDAIRAASVLYDNGAAGIDNWTSSVDDAGFAAEVADTRLDNLRGDLEALGGSLETALIGSGEGSTGILRELTQGATAAVNVFNEMPGPVKNSVTGLLALTAVTGGAAFFGAKVVGGIVATNAALASLGITARITAGSLATAGKSAGAFAVIGAVGFGAKGTTDTFMRSRDAVDATAKSVEDLTKVLTASNVGKFSADLGVDVGRLAEDLVVFGKEGKYAQEVFADLDSAAYDSGAALRDIGTKWIPTFTSGAEKGQSAQKDLGSIIKNNTELLGSGRAEYDKAAAAQAELDRITDQLTGSTKGSANAQRDQAKALNESTQAMRDKVSATLAAFDAETSYRQAVKSATEAAKNNSAGIKGNSDAALENRGALSSLAGAWNNQSSAVKNSRARFQEAKGTFIETATAMGVPKKAAEALARELLEIPRSTLTKTTVETGQAMAAVSSVKSFLASIPSTVQSRVVVTTTTVNGGRSTGGGITRADGGTVPGQRYPYADKTLILAAPGEEVVTNRNGEADRFRADRAAGRIPAYANGGTVGRSGGSAGGANGILSASELRAMGAGVKRFNKELKAATEGLQDQRQELKSLKADRASLKASVGSSLGGDLFGNGLAGFDLAMSANTNDANAGRRGLKAAQRKGLGGKNDRGGLFEALSASGDLDAISQFAGLSRREIRQREAQFAQLNRAQSGFGGVAANEVFGATVDQLAKQVRELKRDKNALSKAIRGMGKNVEEGARRGSSERGRRTSQQIRTGAKR